MLESKKIAISSVFLSALALLVYLVFLPGGQNNPSCDTMKVGVELEIDFDAGTVKISRTPNPVKFEKLAFKSQSLLSQLSNSLPAT